MLAAAWFDAMPWWAQGIVAVIVIILVVKVIIALIALVSRA